jgi:hypothetical protein
MWRGLYRDHWLLGAYKDTMPRRKWLKLIGSTLVASSLARPSSGQQPSPAGKQINFVIIDEAGAPESWEGSHPLSPFSSLNLSTTAPHPLPFNPSATVGRILTAGKSNKTAKLATLSSSEGLEGSTDTLTTPNQELSHHLQEFTTN